MKLYYAPGVCSLSPHIVLREAGLPFDLVTTDIRAKTMAGGADFRDVNPLGYVPALALDDGTLLTEGPAIVQYIADLVPDKKLAPPNGTIERTRLQGWLNFVATELHRNCTPILSPVFSGHIGEEGKQAFRNRLATRFAHLDEHFSKNDYLMGSAFTVADAYAFVITGWAPRVGVDLEPYPNLRAYRARIQARPAVEAAMRAEGLIS